MERANEIKVRENAPESQKHNIYYHKENSVRHLFSQRLRKQNLSFDSKMAIKPT